MDLNFVAPINTLGYGQVGWHVLKELEQLGVNVAYFPIGDIQNTLRNNPQERHDTIMRAYNRQDFFNPVAPSIRLWHQFSLAEHVGHGKKFGWPIFELDNFTDREIHHLVSQDEIIVCSQWAKDVLIQVLGSRVASQDGTSTHNFWRDKVHVVPLGVDSQVFTPAASSTDGTYTFLAIGKWEYRKGHDLIVDAFNQAFSPQDDVELWMMCDNPFISREDAQGWELMYRQSKLGGKVRILPRVGTNAEVADIMRASDCGVFPARAEGWNLELLEMMACSRPVITTFYSGHTEFCSPENARLIEVNELEEAFDGTFFKGGVGQWAKLDASHAAALARHMRELYDSKTRTNPEGAKTAEKYSWTQTAKKLMRAAGL